MVLVRINEDPEALEVILVAKDRAGGSTILSHPYSHPIAVEVTGPMYLEFNFDLDIFSDHCF